jgi:hypothetical protein
MTASGSTWHMGTSVKHPGRKTTCSTCGEPLDTTGRYCRACRAAYMRRRRANGHETLTPATHRKHAIRRATNTKLARWGIRYARCQLCHGTSGRLEGHHPTFDDPRASWIVVVLHAACRRAVMAGVVETPTPIDLGDVRNNREHLPEWLAPR